MKLFKSLFCSRLVAVALLLALSALSGCATGPKTASYSFEYSAGHDKWEQMVELLDLRFGTDKLIIRDVPKGYLGTKYVKQGDGIYGSYPTPETLYLKWRIKATGEILEKTVNFKDILPKDLNKQTITFLFEERQLFVYLVTDKFDRNNLPKEKTWKSNFINLITYEIYPTNKLPKALQE